VKSFGNVLFKKGIAITKLLDYECRLLRKDGEYRRHIVRGQPMFDKKGKLLRLLILAVDIEDIERTTEERDKLEQINAALERQSSVLLTLNKSKDEFISLASHQLRTPATGVKQFLGMVLDNFAGDITSEQRGMLTRAYDSNERQIKIINDLLKVAQADAGKVVLHKKKVDLEKLVQEVLGEQASKFSARGQKVSYKSLSRPIIVRADAARLRMVLDNIIDNASKYTYEGSTITVKVSHRQGKVYIAVQDAGVGIAPADLGKLFHKFTRLDNPLSEEAGGTGLGLYWAKKIIDLHGGTIRITSKLRQGSTFTLILPL
jgi:signal transduction histidine kinase